MLIVWRGWGILTPFMAFVVWIVPLAVVESALGHATYSRIATPLSIASALLAAASIWIVGRTVNGVPGRLLLDPRTGQQVLLRKHHDLFFIPMQYWAFPVALLGIIVAFAPPATSTTMSPFDSSASTNTTAAPATSNSTSNLDVPSAYPPAIALPSKSLVPRPLVAANFSPLGGRPTLLAGAVIGGARYDSALRLYAGPSRNAAASVTLDTRTLPGYDAVRVWVGAAQDSAPDAGATIEVAGDGTMLSSDSAAGPGAAAAIWEVPFEKHRFITFTVRHGWGPSGKLDVLLANPVALKPSAIAVALVPPSPGYGAGYQLLAIGRAAPNSSVTLIVDYPSGARAVFGPKPTIGDQFSFLWMVPPGLHGRVLVTTSNGTSFAQDAMQIAS